MLKAKLTIYELDDYDEEDTYWKLKIGENRNLEIKNDPHPYYYMETYPCWSREYSVSPVIDNNYFRLLIPEEFEMLRISIKDI